MKAAALSVDELRTQARAGQVAAQVEWASRLRAGQGVAAAALATAGVTLFDEQQLTEAARWLAANEAEHAPR